MPFINIAAKKLPPEEPLGVLNEAWSAARNVEDDRARFRALAALAERLPAEQKPKALQEALSVARALVDPEHRALALAIVVQLLPLEEQSIVLQEVLFNLQTIRRVGARAQVVAAIAHRLEGKQLFPLWTETVRSLAAKGRRDCVADLGSLIPLVSVVGSEDVMRNLGQSIVLMGRWWPNEAAGVPPSGHRNRD